MICPNCGKKTHQAEKCEHCKQSTEFAHRSNIRPGKIPGMKDIYPEVSVKTASPTGKITPILAVVSMLSVLASILIGIKYLQLLPKVEHMISETTVATDTEEESNPVEKSEQHWILLYNNVLDEQKREIIGKIQFGSNLPVLPDTENYYFDGWNTAQNGTGMSFQAGDPFMIQIVEDLSLYAQWKAKSEETVPMEIVIPNESEPESTTEETSDVEEGTTSEITTAFDNGVNINE